MIKNCELHKIDTSRRYINIKFGDNRQQYINMDELYRYVRSIQNNYFIGNNISDEFNSIAKYLRMAEDNLPKEYIIESAPKLIIKPNTYEESKLKTIIESIRNSVLKDTEDSLIDKCTLFSNLVSNIAKDLGINSRRVVIYPGFSKKDIRLHFGSGYHAFNIITINNKRYIIDLSYRQFFLSNNNSLERIGVCSLFNTMPGRFMTLNDSRIKTATKLLKDGYIEMTEENIKNYFDGFALSFRNATYYDETLDFSFTTDYTPYDYIRFINEDDSQLNHEGIDRLGYQKKMLRNPNIRFTK